MTDPLIALPERERAWMEAWIGGRDWSGIFMLTDTWILRGEQWQVVSRHGTGPLPDPAA